MTNFIQRQNKKKSLQFICTYIWFVWNFMENGKQSRLEQVKVWFTLFGERIWEAEEILCTR